MGLVLEIVHDEIFAATRADMWPSRLGQVDARSSAGTKNACYQVG